MIPVFVLSSLESRLILNQILSAADDHQLSGNVFRLIGTQKNNPSCKVIGISEPPKRHGIGVEFFITLIGFIGHRGRDSSWNNCVDPYIIFCHFSRQGYGKTVNRGFVDVVHSRAG